MKKFFRSLTIFITFILEIIFAICAYIYYETPDNYRVTTDCSLITENIFPVRAAMVQKEAQVPTLAGSKRNDTVVHTASITFLSVPIKNVNLEYVDNQRVIPCGQPFGVKIFTKGVVVVGISDVKTRYGIERPAKKMGIKKGDIILRVNQEEIRDNDQMLDVVQRNSNSDVVFEVLRGNILFEISTKPVLGDDNLYHVGIWVRDSSAGVGTLTFFDKDTNFFAGLGHGICDIDTGDLLPLSHGEIVKASINGIVKGRRGVPGELKGYFIESDPIGELLNNTTCGVFGYLNGPISEAKPVTVAMKQQIKIGRAQIMSTIDGVTPDYFEINIESINYNERQPCKNMVIKITDERLLEQTGGIIQGMSGSPILQDGMLVGAITHVFVNDPQKGYGIFAENMLPVCAESPADTNNALAS